MRRSQRVLRGSAVLSAGVVLLAIVALFAGAASFASGTTTYRDEVLADSPRAYWRLGETSGTTAVDQLGANPATYLGGVALNQPGGQVNDADPAVTLDGNDDYMQAPATSALDLTTAGTVEFWAKRTAISGKYEAVVGKPTHPQSKFENYSVWINTINRFQAYWGDGSTYVSVATGPVTDTNWHYVVSTYDGSTVKVYLDGVLQEQKATTLHPAANTKPLYFGRASTNANSFFSGSLDEVAIYGSALSQTRITAHYNKGREDATAPVIGLTQPANGAVFTTGTTTFSGVAGRASGDSTTVTIKIYAGTSATGTPAQTLTTTRGTNGAYSTTGSVADGTWTAQAEQSDGGGNVGRSTAATFTIDTTPPPAPTIDSSPPSSSASSTAQFGFSDTEAGAVFECKLDGAAFASCGSPVTYNGLSEGSHTFQVRAVDGVGNRSAATSYAWTVDLTPPTTTISSGPADPSGSTSATFAFSSNDPLATLSCSLDSAPYASCTSPKTYTGLADGAHTFRVFATDAAGNAGPTASRAWTVDTTAPVATITSAPTSPTSSTNATFTFSANDAGAHFECRLDGAAFAACTSPQTYSALAPGAHSFDVRAIDTVGNTGAAASASWTIDTQAPTTTITAGPTDPSNDVNPSFSFVADKPGVTFECDLDGGPFTACTSPLAYSNLTDGSHTFQVRGRDTAGNTGPAASRTWTIDSAAPTVTIGSKPSDPSSSTDATFSFLASEAGATFQCSLDGATWATCTSPTTYSGLADGPHSFSVKAIDQAGNTSAPVTYSWTISSSAPAAPTIDSGPADPSNSTSATFAFSSTEAVAGFDCSLDTAAFSACISPQTYNALSQGSHTFRVRARNALGTTSAPASATWTVDTVPPPVPTINSSAPNPSDSPTADFTFSSAEFGVSYSCQLDGGGFSSCTSPQSYTGLADGSHTFSVRARDAAGNESSAASYTWTIDTVAPTTTITSGPSSPTGSTSATFTFTANQPSATFECNLDGAGFAACSSPQTYTGLSDGAHTLQVRASDEAGNTGLPASFSWTVDSAPPPQPSIDSSPPATSPSASATFAFSDAEAGVTFRCELDGGGFAACTSPKTYTGLADGSHTFNVKARDELGNESAVASYTWSVDTTAPAATIDSGPADPTNSTSATFTFSANQPGATFECRLDAGAFSSCSSPQSYSGLAEGTHTFAVRASDLAGNTGLPAQASWRVDLTAPTAPTINSGPAAQSSSASATFSFSHTEPGVTFECELDGGGFSACTSSKTYTGLADGSHTFHVRARDAAGNVSPAATYNWSIDTTAPTATITSSPPNPSNSTTPSFSFTANEAGSTFECRLDGSPFAACTSPQSYSGLTGGNHVFTVRATDPAGNTGPSASYSWTVDTVAPTVTILTKPSSPSADPNPSFTFSATEAGATFECRLDAAAFTACTSPKSYSGVSDGSHTFEVRATDRAGNTGPATSYTWTTDTTAPPQPQITSSPNGLTQATSATFAFNDGEAGVTFRCQLDGAGFAACTSPKTYTGLSDGSHTFQVRARDDAGNDSAAASFTWTVDTTAPTTTITSSPSNPSNQSSPSFSFTSNEPSATFECQLDGGGFSACTSPKAYTNLPDGSHAFDVRATDSAGNTGNSAHYAWTVETVPPPVPTITSSPSNPSNSASATFGFSDTEVGATFVCQLDGNGFSACTSPKTYTGLADGSHTFQVKARDAASNESAAATATWTVDTTGPTTTITASPSNPSNQSAPSFSFSANEAVTGFQCRLDSASFSVCTSPQGYTGLAEGSHTFQVKSTDVAGNTGATASYTWTIDVTPPAITLTAPANGGSTAVQQPTFSGTGSAADLTITVKVYAGSSATGTPLQTLTTSPGTGGAYQVTATGALSPGTYTARAEQQDAAGNVGMSSANTFAVTDPVMLAAGDIASCGADGDEQTAALLDANPDAIVAPLGDLAYDKGQPSEFANCYDPNWGRAKSRTRPVTGGHDYGTVTGGPAPGTGFFNYFQNQLAPFGSTATDPSKGYYSYDLGAWHVVVLNASCFDIAPGCNEAQQEYWLRADLDAHSNACTMAMWHDPRFNSGSIHGNNLNVSAFWNILYSKGADLILNGHEHLYERFAPQDPAAQADSQYGMREFIVGTGGFSHYPFGTIQPNSEVRNADTYGVLKLTLHPGGYDFQFLPVAGGTFTDSGSGTCHGAPPPPPPAAPSVRSASSASVNAAAALSIAKPTGAAQGDLLLAIVAHQGGTNRTMTPPAGWTAVPNTDYAQGTNARIHAWYKFAGASEPSSYTFNLSGSEDQAGGVLAITGARAAAPINASLGQVSTTSTVSVVAPSITTTVANALLVFGGAVNVTATFTPPALMNEWFDVTSGGPFRVSTEAAVQVIASAGATGTRSALLSTSGRSVAISIAIAPP